MYQPLAQKFGKSRLNVPKTQMSTTTMAKGGENLRDLPQFLSPEYALEMTNYLVTTDGGLEKRKGLTHLFEVAGVYPVLMLEEYDSDHIMFAYNKTLAVYKISADSITTIKSNFVTSGFSGQRYGSYFFVASPSDAIGRVSRTLNYDGQTGNFTAGKKVTGTTSGATAVILEDADSGAAGTLTLGDVVGTFINNEPITDTVTGAAVVDGTITWTYTTVSGAPTAKVIKVVGARLFAGNLLEDETAVAYCQIDGGSNPPFSTWTAGTLADDAGRLNYRNAGGVNAIESLGSNVIVFSEFGKWAFYINTIDSAGTLRKVDVVVISRLDLGGARGAKATPKGLFYVNSSGIWQLISVGQPNIPFSDQEGLNTVLLGTQFFSDVDLTDIDITYLARYNTVLVTCSKNSTANNLVLAFNVENKSISELEGWNINRFLNINQVIYGGGSASTEVWKCFDGYSDDGKDIWTNYYQELKTGDLETRQMLLGMYIQGFLSASTTLDVRFDIYDTKGILIKDKMVLQWTAQGETPIGEGYGVAGWGTSGFGGDVDLAGLYESFDGAKFYIRNYQRIRVRISGHDKLPHKINWLKLLARSKAPIRRRKITQTS